VITICNLIPNGGPFAPIWNCDRIYVTISGAANRVQPPAFHFCSLSDRPPAIDNFSKTGEFLGKALLAVLPQRQQPAALRLEHKRDRFIGDDLARGRQLQAERPAV
jgi:hypothetical protein